MIGKWRAGAVGVALACAVAIFFLVAAKKPTRRESLMQTYQAGNYKDAYEGLRKLALDPEDDRLQVGKDLETGINCLQQLGRSDEIDAFREAVIDVHHQNWRLLDAAAQTYAGTEHYGYIVAGKFYRGYHAGGGRYVSTMPRDRARGLQLMQQAMDLTTKETDKAALAEFHLHFANLLLTDAAQAWRLQYLTDLTQLPDYEDGYSSYGDTHGAPVDAKGNAVFHHVPRSYSAAQSDGERWRWMLVQAAELDASRLSEVEVLFANFLRQQFDVQTMASPGRYVDDDRPDQKSGTYALHTLSDRETIAQLATGLKRFKLPDEFNWIRIYQRVAARGKSASGEQARDALARVYEDRRQYVKAAAAWMKGVEEYGAGQNNWRQQRFDQIVGNWGRFETGQTQPAGTKATVDFRYRNGNRVTFEAFAVKVPKLLDDVKAYLKSSPGQLDWNRLNIGDVGSRLVWQGDQQYVGDKVASWEMKLKPRPEHVDERVTVTTPLKKPGAYLLTAQMAGGNVSRVIVWVSDTVIVKKQLDGKAYYYVADAVTGQPVAGANVEFFGYKQVQVNPQANAWRVETTNFAETTDRDGQVIVPQNKLPNDHNWLIVARKAKAGGERGVSAPRVKDRFAYLGFTNVWYGQTYDAEYNQTKVFTITDRPVYRPQQTVQFKLWVRHAKYDQPDTSSFADQQFTVQVHNPQNQKVFEKSYTSDAYGGLAGEFPLPKGAMLGVYGIQIVNHGGGSFRVEEYKKPEFEVQVEAPKEPVRLGEQIVATINAKYYFGAPVTRAKVKYKVLRSSYASTWYPRGDWDWFYGTGYWWFASDYPWYPGWSRWGCRRPLGWWLGTRQEQPEIVLENEVPVGPDGTVKVPIDTRPAKELHGNEDHQYSITAEVVDESRRTIVGTGNVLVARKPFQVFAWVDRGHYRAGDTVRASFRAQTLDGKPVEGKGKLTLLQITYDDKNEPVEKPVQTWNLDTGAEGHARQQLKAAEAGQYRLSYNLTDAKKHTIEGGYLFVVRGRGFDGHDFRFNDIELITDKREYAPGEKVKLLVNTNRAGGVVLLFVRPANGVYLPPKVLRLTGKSTQEQIAVVQRDMPNFFIEAVTVANGAVHAETREVIVPPEKRVLNVTVLPSQPEYRPGQKAAVKVKLTDFFGKPFAGSTVLTVYDKSVEYIAGGSNVPEIREFFWKWRRNHYPQTESSLDRMFANLLRQGELGMANLGIFGELVVGEKFTNLHDTSDGRTGQFFEGGLGGATASRMSVRGELRKGLAVPNSARFVPAPAEAKSPAREAAAPPPAPPVPPVQQPVVRKNFADTAFWAAALTTNKDGVAEVALTMPENLTGWKVKAWAMGHGTKVGQGEAEVVTKKDLLVRLQAPRFFVQKDEVVLSANVHNYLKTEKNVTVALELEGGTLVAAAAELRQQVRIPAASDRRVDWRVKVEREGEAVVRMKALTDEESDAMEMRFPCYVHGMLKTDSFAGVVRPDKDVAKVTLNVPAERRINETRLEVRYSPTLAGAMVDALPYLVEYPYGCTEQTLNRFVPTVVTQKVLQDMKLDLKDIEKKRTNLNAQEIGDDKARARGWKRYERNPVFDEAQVRDMAKAGVQALTAMQLHDGGWGWFSGYGEHSYAHTTAVVVHGL
ncbi:MAG TPA: MG2 domain-containing protein, partial [Gemmataceae bacterium]|nr:MG2 domain-containing protein [Gemmataceae bacterium]